MALARPKPQSARAPAKAPRAPRERETLTARQRILAAAIGSFSRHGFRGASLPDIAREARTTNPLIIYHYGSKEQLWRACIDEGFGDLAQVLTIFTNASPELSPLDALKVAFRVVMRAFADHPAHVVMMKNEVRALGPLSGWVIEQHLRPLHAALGALVETAVRDGSIKPVPTGYLVELLLASAHTPYESKPAIQVFHGVDPHEHAFHDSHADWLLEIIFRGVERHD